MKPLPARPPVFVDSSGHRHRRIRRLGVLVAVPVVGYLLLLVSSVLGGPSVDTPLIPLPEAAKQQPAPRVTPAPGQTVEPSEPARTTDTTVRPVNEANSTPTPGESATPGTQPTTTPSAPTATPTTSSTPTITPGPPATPSGHGKPTAPPGRTKSPSKP